MYEKIHAEPHSVIQGQSQSQSQREHFAFFLLLAGSQSGLNVHRPTRPCSHRHGLQPSNHSRHFDGHRAPPAGTGVGCVGCAGSVPVGGDVAVAGTGCAAGASADAGVGRRSSSGEGEGADRRPSRLCAARKLAISSASSLASSAATADGSDGADGTAAAADAPLNESVFTTTW